MKQITQKNSDALLHSINYWIEHWDWEYPTLFGLEQSEFQLIANNWPTSLSSENKITLIACLGSLRELLYGASAVSKTNVQNIIGINYEQASELCSSINQQLEKYEL